MTTSKYVQLGPYHWDAAEPRSVLRYQPHVQANYLAVERTLASLPAGAPRTVLDIGCGDGVLTWRLMRRGFVVVGMDCDLQGLALANREVTQRGRRPILLRGDGMLIPFRDAAFDAVCAVEVVEHLPDVDRFLSETARVLKPGGHIVVTTPHRRDDGVLHSVHHTVEFSPQDLEATFGLWFEDVAVRGIRPKWAEGVYRGSGRLGRLLIRVLSRYAANPYARTMSNPGGAETLLAWATRPAESRCPR
jgi:SAM-dependent methyltransferase